MSFRFGKIDLSISAFAAMAWRACMVPLGRFMPRRHEFGFTADMDNADFSEPALESFRKVFSRELLWQRPSASQMQRFRDHGALRKAADNLIAASHAGRCEYWVLDNNWSGFPDPAEFLFVGFTRGRKIFAAGRFEDWPENWRRAYHISEKIPE